MKVKERIKSMETYLSGVILGEFPSINPGNITPGHMGVTYSMLYTWDKDKKKLTLGVETQLSEHSPEWLDPVLKMCLVQIRHVLREDGVRFLKYFSQPLETLYPQKMGDIYLNIQLYDHTFMYHLPLGCAMHLLTEEELIRLRRIKNHKFCREAIKELENRVKFRE